MNLTQPADDGPRPPDPGRTDRAGTAGGWPSITLTIAALLLTLPACRAEEPAPENGTETIPLPAPDTTGRVPLEQTLQRRRSVRAFQDTPLDLAVIGQIVWSAQGITETARGLRTTPSAGALYPLTLYVVTAEGLDRYDPQAHRMQRIRPGDPRQRLAGIALGQQWVRDAPLNVILAARYDRITQRYGERGRFYAHLEAGHAAQNMLLQAVALDLGAVPVGAFQPDELADLLNLPSGAEPLYILSFGKPATSNPPAAAAPAHGVIEIRDPRDLEPMFDSLGERRLALLGESTHGTREYYEWRDRISRRLIRERGFRFVVVEADWAAIQRLNAYVQHRTPPGQDARAVLRGLHRWPRWMWANESFADFLEWLRAHNETLDAADAVGLYGLDMQDPQDSMNRVLEWFERHAPGSLEEVSDSFAPLRGEPGALHRYARGLTQGEARIHDDLARILASLAARDAAERAEAALFSVKQNVRAVKSAEARAHAMTEGGAHTWNVRARYMAETVRRLADRYGETSRGIVWAHNTHVGDASATEMAARGEINIGQLLRQDPGADHVFILGFATAAGTVAAGAAWEAPMEVMTLSPPREHSLEARLRALGLPRALLLFDTDERRRPWIHALPHRAIGVVYRPPHDGYVQTVPARRYDALIYMDETQALTPLN